MMTKKSKADILRAAFTKKSDVLGNLQPRNKVLDLLKMMALGAAGGVGLSAIKRQLYKPETLLPVEQDVVVPLIPQAGPPRPDKPQKKASLVERVKKAYVLSSAINTLKPVVGHDIMLSDIIGLGTGITGGYIGHRTLFNADREAKLKNQIKKRENILQQLLLEEQRITNTGKSASDFSLETKLEEVAGILYDLDKQAGFFDTLSKINVSRAAEAYDQILNSMSESDKVRIGATMLASSALGGLLGWEAGAATDPERAIVRELAKAREQRAISQPLKLKATTANIGIRPVQKGMSALTDASFGRDLFDL